MSSQQAAASVLRYRPLGRGQTEEAVAPRYQSDFVPDDVRQTLFETELKVIERWGHSSDVHEAFARYSRAVERLYLDDYLRYGESEILG